MSTCTPCLSGLITASGARKRSSIWQLGKLLYLVFCKALFRKAPESSNILVVVDRTRIRRLFETKSVGHKLAEGEGKTLT